MKMCFTGHRPDKLPGKYDWSSVANFEMMHEIMKKLSKIQRENSIDEYIFGGALGIDQMAFAIVRESNARKERSEYRMMVAVPFKEQPIKWFNQSDIERYSKQLDYADKVVYVDELPNYDMKNVEIGKYHPAKMQLRNQYMVDNSDLVFAVWDGSNGGTKNCIDYARKQGKKIYIFDPNTLELREE